MQKVRVLDLFSGMGGFSAGFSSLGAQVTGVDVSEPVGLAYRALTGGNFVNANLHFEAIEKGFYDIIVGGPPCRPWSSINVTKRGEMHPDYTLVSKFVEHIRIHRPRIFFMENVPPLGNDPIFKNLLNSTRSLGYSVNQTKVTYSDFGASLKRTRLLLVGSIDLDSDSILWQLNGLKRNAKTVSDAIIQLRDIEYGEVSDHVWPKLKTIEKYKKYYETGKYGWRILKWNEPSPSFGNVMKTYTLHPDSSFLTGSYRPISIAETARIMGFPNDFVFPNGIPMGKRYQMIVDSVNPVFSKTLASIALKKLTDSFDYVS